MWKCGNVQVSPKLSKVADLHQQNNLIGPWKLSVRALSFSIGFNIISSSGNYEFRLVPCPSLWLSYIGVRSTLSFLLLFPSCWLEFLDWAQPWLITLRYLVTTGLLVETGTVNTPVLPSLVDVNQWWCHYSYLCRGHLLLLAHFPV